MEIGMYITNDIVYKNQKQKLKGKTLKPPNELKKLKHKTLITLTKSITIRTLTKRNLVKETL